MSDFPGELYELIGGGEALFLSAGLLILAGSGGIELGYGEGTWAPPYTPIVAAPIGESRWNDCDGDWYSLFWVVLGPIMPWVPLVPPFLPGPNTTSGSTATPAEISAVKRQILKWKSPYGYPVKVILRFPGVVLPGRFGVTPPWTQHDQVIPFCTWEIGKTTNDTIHAPPFIPGGYQV